MGATDILEFNSWSKPTDTPGNHTELRTPRIIGAHRPRGSFSESAEAPGRSPAGLGVPIRRSGASSSGTLIRNQSVGAEVSLSGLGLMTHDALNGRKERGPNPFHADGEGARSRGEEEETVPLPA